MLQRERSPCCRDAAERRGDRAEQDDQPGHAVREVVGDDGVEDDEDVGVRPLPGAERSARSAVVARIFIDTLCP